MNKKSLIVLASVSSAEKNRKLEDSYFKAKGFEKEKRKLLEHGFLARYYLKGIKVSPRGERIISEMEQAYKRAFDKYSQLNFSSSKYFGSL